MNTVEHTSAPSATVYDGFISYSHAADDLLAPRLQSALQKFAKPWWKRRALRVFRDQISLSASPHLWTSITAALDDSSWLILLLSPNAASSQWVNQEIEYWVRHKGGDRIIPVVTEGSFEWRAGDVEGSSIPEELRGVFAEEPRWVDLRFARDDEQLDLQNARYADAIADIACTLRDIPKDELQSEEVRQHRRTMRTAWTAGIGLAVLAIASAAGWMFALEQRDDVRRERDRLAFSQLVNRSLDEADQDLELALLLAVEAYQRIPGPESTQALLNALTRLPAGLTVFGEPAHSDTAKTEFCRSTTPRPGIFVSVGGAAGEGEVVVFDAEAGEIELRTTVPFNCSARLLPDGRLLGFDTEGEPSHVIVDSDGQVTRLPSQVRTVFNQLGDGRFLAEWHNIESDAETGRLVVLDGHSGELVEETGVATIDLVVDPTGRRAVTQAVTPGDADSAQISTRSIVDLDTFTETSLETAPEAIYTWDPDGSTVLAIVGEELLRFDLSGRLIDTTQLQTEGGAPSDLSFSPAGNVMAVATSAGLEVLDYPDLEPVAEPVAVDYQMGAMSMIDDDRVATQDRGGVVRVVSLSGSGALENRVAFGRFNDALFMLSPEYGLVWPGDVYEGYTAGVNLPVDLSTGEIFDPYAELGVQPSEGPVPMTDGLWVVQSESHNSLIDESGSELLEIRRQSGQIGLANTFADGRWGHWLDASGSDLENVTEVHITSLDVIEREVTVVKNITVSGWLGRPASGEAGFWAQNDTAEEVEVYDWSGELLGVISGSIRFGSALSRDGSRLAVVQSNRSVWVYDVQSGDVVAELLAESHHEAPLFLDPERIVVRSTDGRVVLWSVATAAALGTLADAPDWPPSLDWGTSGYEPTMSWDGTSFWFTQPGEFIEITVEPSAWVEAACAAAGRALTETEWEELVPFNEPYRNSCEP